MNVVLFFRTNPKEQVSLTTIKTLRFAIMGGDFLRWDEEDDIEGDKKWFGIYYSAMIKMSPVLALQ